MIKNRIKYISYLFIIFIVAFGFLCSCSKKVNYYKLEYIAGVGGYIVGNAVQTVEEGENGTYVTAVASEGYRFIGWSDNNKDAVRKEEQINENKSLIAQFEKVNYYIVEYITSEGGYIIGNTIQTVKEGDNGMTVTAVASEGYRFAGWTDGPRCGGSRCTMGFCWRRGSRRTV